MLFPVPGCASEEGFTFVNRLRKASVVLVYLSCLAGALACSSAAAPLVMPPDRYHLPTVLGPLSGTGSKTFTVTVRASMSVELSCLGDSKDLAQARGQFLTVVVPCTTLADQSFGGAYNAADSQGRLNGVKVGRRAVVRIIAPARDTWQLWITGGPVPAP